MHGLFVLQDFPILEGAHCDVVVTNADWQEKISQKEADKPQKQEQVKIASPAEE
ncbi:hypothetical protein AGMMS49949_09260 [Alphaproteobacteria bacterium]|nr:hypothetical protein AGMMS49949_09260 [Alphaproteobacteria bacterium]GHS95825.1 hypothetical protein AGMMS50296_1070 [Alphaproteobacteria bacterium]